MQRLADEFVGDVWTVELRSVDVVDTGVYRPAQHRQRLVSIPGGPNTPGPGRLHGAEPDAVDVVARPAGNVA